jgi:hypothetical protein
MPTCVLEAYVSRLAEIEAQRRYDAAVAASVPHWTPESANSYLNDLWKVIEQARLRVSSAFQTGKQAADDLLAWFRSLGFGEGSGVD